MTIIIDSNFLFALTFRKDKNHERALEILSELKDKPKHPIITNNLVLEEILSLVIFRFNGNIYYLDNINELIWGKNNFFQIQYLTKNDYLEMFNILKKFTTSKRLLSSVDASLIFSYQKLNAREIISFDSHFDGILNRTY